MTKKDIQPSNQDIQPEEDRIVHFTYNIQVGWHVSDFDGEWPSDEELIQASKENLNAIVRDWVSDGDYHDPLCSPIILDHSTSARKILEATIKQLQMFPDEFYK